MSVIQTIREKYARIAAIAIALAILGFIAMDAFTGRSQFFGGGGPSGSIGSVNGKNLRSDAFRLKVAMVEQNMEQTQRYLSAPERTEQAIDKVWNEEVALALLEEEVDKLGIRVGKKELNHLLFVNPPASLRQQFTNPETGQYEAQRLSEGLQQNRRSRRSDVIQQTNNFLDGLVYSRMEEKYNSLFINSYNVPKWMIEKQNAENALMAKIAIVKKPYTDISDSSVKVTDREIEDYISKHKQDFKQEETRSIAYVTFSGAPSAADSSAIRNELEVLKPSLASTPDAEMESFLVSKGSEITKTSYISGKELKLPNKDSIIKLPAGSVYGPYIDGGYYALAKMMDVRQVPDSIKVRHILISTVQQDQQGNPQQIRDSSQARILIDSVQKLIASGQPFDSVCVRFSEDNGSKQTGGVYTFASGASVPEFNNFIVTNPVGQKGVVYTQFGFHYIEILSQKGSSTGYRIAQLNKPIQASAETDQKAHADASNFALESRDEKTFNDVFAKKWQPKGYSKGIAMDIRPSAYSIMGLGFKRELVRKIYEAKRGEVLQPEEVNGNYVVALVTGIHKEGIKDASKARLELEPILKNKKKAELIKKQIGTVTSLEDVATKLGKQITPYDSVRIGSQNMGIGFEPKVIGAAVNPANRGKLVTEPIEGAEGVIVMRVDNVTATAITTGDVLAQKKAMYEQGKFSPSRALDVLREAAKIKDRRAEHY